VGNFPRPSSQQLENRAQSMSRCRNFLLPVHERNRGGLERADDSSGVDLGGQRRIVEGGNILQHHEFHGLAVPGLR
jgi:hypothetical protein